MQKKIIKTKVSDDGSQSYVRRDPVEHKFKGSYTKAGNTAIKTARAKGRKGQAAKVSAAVKKAEAATKGFWPEDQ